MWLALRISYTEKRPFLPSILRSQMDRYLPPDDTEMCVMASVPSTPTHTRSLTTSNELTWHEVLNLLVCFVDNDIVPSEVDQLIVILN